MGDKTRRLFRKFIVRRTDGTSDYGKKHDGCEYFVLDLTHDPYAKAAALAYVEACKADYPLLAADMIRDFKLPAVAVFSPAPTPTFAYEGWEGEPTLHELECADGDRLMAALGIDGDIRTEGGWLRMDKALERIAQLRAVPAAPPTPESEKK